MHYLKVMCFVYVITILLAMDTYGSSDQYHILALKAALNRQWDLAWKNAVKSNTQADTKEVLSILRFLYDYDNAEIDTIDFILNDNIWVLKAFRSKVDALLNIGDKRDYEVIKALDKLNAHSTKSKILLYNMRLANKQGHAPSLKREIAKLWSSSIFCSTMESYIQKHYVSSFKLEAIKRKIRLLLWHKRKTLASSLIKLLPQNDKDVALYNMQIKALGYNLSQLAKLYRTNKTMQNNEFIKYLYATALLQDKQDVQAVQLLLSIKNTPYAEVLWKAKNIAIRHALRDKRYSSAFNLATTHGLHSGLNFIEAEWLSGFIALRFLHKPKEAVAHFRNMYNTARFSHSKSQAMYWLGRAFLEMRDEMQANTWFKLAAANFPHYFYGQLATLEVGSMELEQASLNKAPSKVTSIKLKKLSFIAKALFIAGFKSDAVSILQYIASEYPNFKEAKGIVQNYAKSGLYPLAVLFAKALANHGYPLIADSYPLCVDFDSRVCACNKVFYLAIIRQESSFDQEAVSPAGAIGLMQLMPSTAAQCAKELYLHEDSYKTNAKANVAKGTFYIDKLMEKWSGNYILTAASYNAGINAVERWVNEYGDPKQLQSLYQILDWIELIPYYETRFYIKKVIENMVNYEKITFTKNIISNLILGAVDKGTTKASY